MINKHVMSFHKISITIELKASTVSHMCVYIYIYTYIHTYTCEGNRGFEVDIIVPGKFYSGS